MYVIINLCLKRIHLTIHLIFIYFGRSFILLQCKFFALTNLNIYTENMHIFTNMYLKDLVVS